ncbi:hypothetical protein P171DRAFT_487468 [Karstenula rhodostoma CBS 690.94]|uniref:Uncharacterized protein n=1 Tax=Karstenula rhodostoma CBS 690.94 TaxID=1392251 RepID=A0A9P4PDP9_9PLEO|nr:hypothetical protein P171DRAFT_487468 [Karstenula rhodostoma CBS 690.94]
MPPAPSNIPEDHGQQPDVSSVEPQAEKSEVTKPAEASSTGRKEDTPQLKRNETTESLYTDNMEFARRGASRPFDPCDEFVPPPRLPRPVRRVLPPPRRFEYSPPPPRWPASDPAAPLLNSSVQLLEQLNYDGLADLPHPARSSIYLSTFPFTDKDMKDWSWLFQLGIEGKFLSKQGDLRDDDGDDEDDWLYPGDRRGRIAVRSIPYHRGRSDRSPMYAYDSGADIPSVYLSRALDAAIVPESSEKDFTFVIVVRNRGRAGGGAKLLTAGSRKAAGILIYYEALVGHSVVFVGAMKEGVRKGTKAWKYKRVESVEEAATMTDEGIVGVIC